MDAEAQEIRQVRQRASVKWLLSKAFNNRVPENLKEPFFRDHENHERLKPQIIVELGNATLYCQTLSNLFSDPNYQNLNHWSILQTLTRKGVPAAESMDMPLTETVLIQTNPLRINAHMSVIESLMLLYAKEITAGDRVNQAIRRISGQQNYQPPTNQNYEQALLAWVSHACMALKRRVERQTAGHEMQTNGNHEQRVANLSDLPPVRDFQDLCDGVCMALLVAFYCPKWFNWMQVRINYLPAVEDSIHNMSLLSAFSQQFLPCNVFHMTPDDVTFMRGSMKTNLLALLADLFNFFEIHPAECVSYPEMEATDVIAKRHVGANEHGILHRRGLTTQPVIPIPDLRSESTGDSTYSSPSHRPLYQVMRSASTNSSTVMTQKFTPSPTEQLQQQMIERKNCDTSEDFVVHKSRGITTLSSMQTQQLQQQQQQDPLVPARLRQAKEKTNYETKADERGDNIPAGRPSNWEQNRRPSFAGRRSRRNSSSEDSQLTIENFGGSQDQLNNFGRFSQERERERDRERKSSTASIEPVVPVRSSLADARGSIQLGYETDSGSEKQDRDTEKYSKKHNNKSINNDSSHAQSNHAGGMSIVGSPVPSVQMNSNMKLHSTDKDYDPYDDDLRSLESASKLSNIRNKLEEKRRRIENDKRAIELALMKHQGKVPQDEYADHMGSKWETMSNDSKRSPDLDGMDLDKYQQSIAIMNMNLQDIQQDIQRLATQQSQIQAQTLQAQQLIQAQQIANMLNQQQTYGSQQHLAEHYQRNLPPLQAQSNYGSTPHLPQILQQQQQQLQMNSYVSSRPPSRDPYQQLQHQQQQHQQVPHHMQYINENGQYMSPQHQQQQFQSQQPQSHYMSPPIYAEPTTSYSNNHHLMQRNYDDYPTQHQHTHHTQQFYHDGNVTAPSGGQSNNHVYEMVHPPQRRTWSNNMYDQQQQQQHQAQQHQQMQQQQQNQQAQQQQQQQSLVDVNAWQSVKRGNQLDDNIYNTKRLDAGGNISGGGNAGGGNGGFILHQNGGGEYQHLFQVHASPQRAFSSSSPTAPTQQQQQQQQQKPSSMSISGNNGMQQPPSSADDMMAPQSICFIGDEEDVDELERNIIDALQSTRISQGGMRENPSAHIQRSNSSHQQQQQQHGGSGGRESSSEDYGSSSEMISRKLNITSGNLTYRIPSPSRPPLQNNSFQDPQAEKGFYISFDDEQPKRPKPPLRTKRSPKKEKSLDSVDHQAGLVKRESLSQLHNISNNNNNKNSIDNHSNNNDNDNNNNNGKKSHDANNQNNINATYNKYTDMPLPGNVSLRQLNSMAGDAVSLDQLNNAKRQSSMADGEVKGQALIIGTDVAKLDPESVDEMERRKEKIMLLSLQRRQQQEEAKARKEIEASQQREREREKEEERARKKEEQMARRAAILEQHRLKKAIEEAEREGKILERPERQTNTATPRLRQQRNIRPRPKTIHVDDASVDISEASSISSSRGKKGSSTNLTGQYGQLYGSNAMRRDLYKGSQDSLITKASPEEFTSTSSTPVGRRGSYKTSREPTTERGRTLSRISVAKGSTLHLRGRKSNSLMNLCETDSGLGRATPPRRAASPGMAMGGGITSTSTGRHMPSPSGPGSLPPGLVSKRRIFDDGSSDISSNQFSMVEYSGPKLYKQPASKSNRGIILNAVEYCVFPGAVNRDAKQKVLEKIARSEAKHFLILFRDAGCQFRALYSYVPEAEQILKLYGTGPSQVDEVMFDKFFKYNSGGKCFSQVHTKHLTVTIDAFTIHNSLWQGKRVHLPSKKDMALVI